MQKLSQQANANLQRLRRAKPTDLPKVFRELLDQKEGLSEAAEIIEERVASGNYVTIDSLARILAKVKRESLYALVKEQLFSDKWELVTLYRGQYPDQDIEKQLCELLYQRAYDNADPARRYIAEAIRDIGSTATLPVLEAILYDFTTTKGTKNAIANALFCASDPNLESLLAGMVAKSQSEFVQLIAQAIKAVRERNSEQFFPVENSTSHAARVDEELVCNAHRELKWAVEKVQVDPTYTLVCLRRGAEAMGKHLYRHLGHEDKGKPAKKMMLEDLLKPIRDSDAPEIFKICIQALQPFGNYAAHDQDDQFSNVTPQVAEALVVLFREALTIYENWLHEASGESK